VIPVAWPAASRSIRTDAGSIWCSRSARKDTGEKRTFRRVATDASHAAPSWQGRHLFVLKKERDDKVAA